MSAPSSSIRLLDTIEFAKKLNFMRDSATGNFIEPAKTSANMVKQTMLGAPFIWRWNRVVTGFIAVANQQDYTLFNYTASAAVKLGWFTVDDAGNSQVCTTAGTTGSSSPTWNHTATGTTTDGSVTWTNKGNIGDPQVEGEYTMAWIENGAVMDTTSNGPIWKQLQTKIDLSVEEKIARPTYVSAQFDDGNGNLTFRLMPTPDKAYPVTLQMQAKPSLFTKTKQTWAPIPDEYAHIYNWGFLSLMWLFADDPRFTTANGKFISSLLATNTGLSETQRNIFLQNWYSITGQPQAEQIKVTQAAQAMGS